MEHMETLGVIGENKYYGIDFIPESTLELLFADVVTDQDIETSPPQGLTAGNFVGLLNSTTIDCDEPDVAIAIQRFGLYSDAEFIEPSFSEDEFTKAANTTELKISSFIQPEEDSGLIRPVPSFALLNPVDLAQLSMIYNPNNLLALAKELAQASPEGLSKQEVEMIFRYRTILKKIEDSKVINSNIIHAESEDEPSEPLTVGNRKWSGYLHPYGHAVNRIDPHEYDAFSDEPNHYKRLGKYTIEGNRVVLRDREI